MLCQHFILYVHIFISYYCIYVESNVVFYAIKEFHKQIVNKYTLQLSVSDSIHICVTLTWEVCMWEWEREKSFLALRNAIKLDKGKWLTGILFYIHRNTHKRQCTSKNGGRMLRGKNEFNSLWCSLLFYKLFFFSSLCRVLFCLYLIYSLWCSELNTGSSSVK